MSGAGAAGPGAKKVAAIASKYGMEHVQRFLRPWNFKWLPSENIIMVNNPERHADKSEYHFHVPIDMSKPEIKDYLTKVYDLDVVKVNTANYDGKTKYRGGSRQPLKGKRYKKAFVTLASDSGPEPAVVVASKPKPKPKPAGVAKKQQ